MLEELMMKMIEFDCGDPKRIQHFINIRIRIIHDGIPPFPGVP